MDPVLLALLPIIYVVYAVMSNNPAQEQYKKGMEALTKRNPSGAEEFFLKAINNDPLHAHSLLELSKLYESQGMMEKSIYYLKSLQIALADPFDKLGLDSLMRMAEIQYASGRYKDSWENFLLLIRTGFKSSRLFYYLGELYMVQRRYAEAIVYFDESIAFKSDQPRCHYYKALCLIAMNERDEAFIPLRKVEHEPEFSVEAKFLLGKISYDNNAMEEASNYFGQILNEENPIYLKDILFFKGYEVLQKSELSSEDLDRLVGYFNRGANLADIYFDEKKEFLYHLGGAYLLKDDFSEAKYAFQELCRIDAYYKSCDQILKVISKELLISEELHDVVAIYEKFKWGGHFNHEIRKDLNIDVFFPNHLPILVLGKLEELAQKKLVHTIRDNERLAARFDFYSPKTPLDFSTSPYEVFVQSCNRICKKLGLVADKNLADNRNEALFVAVDKDDMRWLVYFYKPAAVIGAIAMADIIDKRDRMEASRVHFLCAGNFTDEAKELADKDNVVLTDKHNLMRLL